MSKVTLKQAAQISAKNVQYLRKQVIEGKIKASKSMSNTGVEAWMIDEKDLQAWIDRPKGQGFGVRDDGRIKLIAYGTPEEIEAAMIAVPTLLVFKAPTHVNPTKRPVVLTDGKISY